MIIRRKHTANFTTIGNALFNDERLAADEVGILAFLLSRPNDWEVRRPALMRRWKIGRDAMKRIVTNWIRTGYCLARKTRLSNGTFHIIYEIRDQPGPSLSEDEVRNALSLVSGEASSDQNEENEDAENLSETGDPPTCQPGVDDQGVATRPRPIETLLNPESPRTESTHDLGGFSKLLEGWPTDHVLSRVAAEGAFASLNADKRKLCLDHFGAYLSDCKASNRKVCDVTTFIREQRWERFAVKAAAANCAVIKPYSPEFHRWREYREFIGDHAGVTTMDTMAKLGRDLTVPSRWPPGKGTGPPSDQHVT